MSVPSPDFGHLVQSGCREESARASAQTVGAQAASRFDSYTFHGFAKRIIDNYRLALTGSSALDADYTIDAKTRIERNQITFDDLVPLAIELLESNEFARGALRQTYSHVFLDEFQDATTAQFQLVREAFLGSDAQLTAVGDVKQRIMAWAGALEGIMQTYAEDFAAQSLTLYQNFRSAPRLRRMQNRMVQEMDPDAAVPVEDLAGEGGTIRTLHFDDDVEEAAAIADLVDGWLASGTPPYEIAVLVRQQPHLVAACLIGELNTRSIPSRNEAARQDLTAEPAAAVVLNFLRVVAAGRHSEAYSELVHLATRTGAEDEAARRQEYAFRNFLRDARATVGAADFDSANATAWRNLVYALLRTISRPVLAALSPEYQQGKRLDQVVENVLIAYEFELAADGDPEAALRRLSEIDAVRILTIHKCKGLEFEKVIVLGVERELFWGKREAALSEFFVAISRAKAELVLTHVAHRERPDGVTGRWDEGRSPHTEFLGYAEDA